MGVNEERPGTTPTPADYANMRRHHPQEPEVVYSALQVKRELLRRSLTATETALERITRELVQKVEQRDSIRADLTELDQWLASHR